MSVCHKHICMYVFVCIYVFSFLYIFFIKIGNEGMCGDKGTLAKQGMDEHNKKYLKNL